MPRRGQRGRLQGLELDVPQAPLALAGQQAVALPLHALVALSAVADRLRGQLDLLCPPALSGDAPRGGLCREGLDRFRRAELRAVHGRIDLLYSGLAVGSNRVGALVKVPPVLCEGRRPPLSAALRLLRLLGLELRVAQLHDGRLRCLCSPTAGIFLVLAGGRGAGSRRLAVHGVHQAAHGAFAAQQHGGRGSMQIARLPRPPRRNGDRTVKTERHGGAI